MTTKVWQSGYGLSPRLRKIAQEILTDKLAREGESLERARIAESLGFSITVRESNWLRNNR